MINNMYLRVFTVEEMEIAAKKVSLLLVKEI